MKVLTYYFLFFIQMNENITAVLGKVQKMSFRWLNNKIEILQRIFFFKLGLRYKILISKFSGFFMHSKDSDKFLGWIWREVLEIPNIITHTDEKKTLLSEMSITKMRWWNIFNSTTTSVDNYYLNRMYRIPFFVRKKKNSWKEYHYFNTKTFWYIKKLSWKNIRTFDFY